jgi:hypothetical protein
LPEEEIDARTIIYTIKLLPYWRFNGYDAPVGTDEQGIPRFNTYYVTLFAKYDKGQNLRVCHGVGSIGEWVLSGQGNQSQRMSIITLHFSISMGSFSEGVLVSLYLFE